MAHPFIIHADDVAEEVGHYPAPFDVEALSFGRNLGKAAGSVHVGLWQERLAPGQRTSFPHAHSAEEELIVITSGQPHVRIAQPGREAVEVPLRPGHVVSFPAGSGIAHTFVNHTAEDCVLLCFGERKPAEDRCNYPESPEYMAHQLVHRPARIWLPDAAGKGPDEG